MKHPVLSGTGYKFYALVWIIVISIHASVLYFYYDFSLTISVIESVVFNFLFAGIVPGLWFIVTFAGLNKDYLSLAVTHIGTALVISFTWSAVSDYFLSLIFNVRFEYIKFLSDSYIWRLIIGVLYYSITVLIFYLIKYYQDMQERVNKELELQTLLKDTELRMLKSQINPHFIFNSLNSISSLTISKPETAREMVIKLSDFLRYSLGKDNVEMNPLEEEVKNVSLYLDIEKIRFGDRLHFEMEISEECGRVEVPNLILQPLLENAIKYGVYDSLEEVTVRLTCKPVEGTLHVSINNNFDEDAVVSKGEGIGLESVRKRLMLIYERSDLLEIVRDSNQFTVTIKIPLT
ncbi:MAG: histidine kinase [Cyclobacteriaceae bacterium]